MKKLIFSIFLLFALCPYVSAATVTKTIGTVSRDYSTITAWEADLDDSGIYSASDDAVGEMYNDSTFDEYLSINGGSTIGLTSVTLSVASGERHDGTAGTGARIEHSSGSGHNLTDGQETIVEWLEIDGNDNLATSSTGFIKSQKGSGNKNKIIRNCIIHNVRTSDAGSEIIFVQVRGQTDKILNNIMYAFLDEEGSTSLDVINADILFGSGAHNVINNTIHNFKQDDTGSSRGISITDDSGNKVQNNLVTDYVGSSGTGFCFVGSYASGSIDTNASEDTTAPGTGSLTEIDPADQYVSTVVGSEDLHLKSGADAIDAGTDIGTSPTNVNIDIDGRDRDTEGDTWDIGADEFVSAGTTPLTHIPQVIIF